MAWAAHPLITEDAYTLGKGVAQVEIGFEHAHFDQPDAEGSVNEVRGILSYGLLENVDVLLGAPYLDTRELSAESTERTRGFGDVALELKWRFWDGELAKFAVKPGLTIPSGNFRKGLGTGRAVPSVFLVSTSERDAWTWNIHVGYLRNENGLLRALLGGHRPPINGIRPPPNSVGTNIVPTLRDYLFTMEYWIEVRLPNPGASDMYAVTSCCPRVKVKWRISTFCAVTTPCQPASSNNLNVVSATGGTGSVVA